MRYWEACEAQVSAEEAIEECRIHEVVATVRKDDGALVDTDMAKPSLMPMRKGNTMAQISSAISATDRCCRERERIVTRMGEDRVRALFAVANRAVRRRRIARGLTFGKLHKIESIIRNRFINVVGPQIQNARFSAMITQPYQLYVERKDRAKNMARFYSMSIEPNLFGELCLTRRWGRIGAKGQTLIHHFGREQDAVALFLDLTRQKRARGYRTKPATARESDRSAPSSVI